MNYFTFPKSTLITSTANIFYLTGFKGSFAELIIHNGNKILLTDSRYELNAKKLLDTNIAVQIIQDYQKDLSSLFTKLKIKTLHIEANDFNYAKYLAYQKLFSNIKLKPLNKNINKLRIIKTDDEIQKMQKAQKLNEKVLFEVKKLFKIGITELEIAKKIEIIGLSLQADGMSFAPIVAFGKNSSCPHHSPTNTKLQAEENILIDMGVTLNSYCSDMSRTFLPKNPSNDLIKIYNLVLEAQEECIKNIKPNITGKTLDQIIRKKFKTHNFDQFYTHASGHGIGLNVHESPSLSSKKKHHDNNLPLAKNMVITVEPGIYLPNKFGIRIEDVICINTPILNLTNFAKTKLHW